MGKKKTAKRGAEGKLESGVRPPVMPMEAKLVEEAPVGEAWQYEPKWDGFRCLAFRRGDEVYLQSKSGKPLARYFPEMVETLKRIGAARFVLDGEIVIAVGGRLSFDELLLRVHPAESRVRKLAAEHPAMYVVFDLLEDERGRSMMGLDLRERRAQLERFAREFLSGEQALRVSPAARDLATAMKWFNTVGASLDGIIAKRVDMPYRSGERDGMQKVKHRRTADCVVGGFRYATGSKVVGSLLLGLYDEAGKLNHVGFTSSFTQAERKKVDSIVEPLKGGAGFSGRAPGGPSRWSTERSGEWERVAPDLVVEVQYDHFSGDRFRHGTKLVRWRPDKLPRQCTMDQVNQGGGGIMELLEARRKPRRKTRSAMSARI